MCLIIHFLAFDISKKFMTAMGMGLGNSGIGKKMGMGMVLWEWEGMGTEIVLPCTPLVACIDVINSRTAILDSPVH